MPAALAPSPEPASLDVLLLRAVARVLRDPELNPHLETLLGDERDDDRAHLEWVMHSQHSLGGFS